ncbi:hypothetical protein CVT24_012622 [Panaeolus cyanescens]|uniref:Carboxylic ester hydrolase n=1 Tax=Panaeolus cyanescens TaxID=181874 RepID=A0A409W697_9AGAR|nr:hypothetical protein CVT24_012622 [Panaeolus cyanescens]
MSVPHLHDELARNPQRVKVATKFGDIVGGRANNGIDVLMLSIVCAEVPYALPPKRFEDPVPLPSNFRYPAKEYIEESTYGAQPLNDGQAAGTPFVDKVGYGKPSENPLFLNIVAPPSFPEKRNFPVKVYIHGGFLQFGSPHGISGQAQFISAERSEVWVNIGYRLSVFGFLASDKPNLSGNYGFKDQWTALEWIKNNIEAFGGDPNNIELSGLSAGAHSVHQLLHHASRLPEGYKAPFQTVILESNAILADPKTQAELRPQFEALCNALDLDPNSPDTLDTLKDPKKVSWKSITHVIETEKLGKYGTFRGCLGDDGWLSPKKPGSPVPESLMEWQRTGGFAHSLRARGVKAVVLGDLKEEWYLYSIAHPINGPADILPNLERYFSDYLSQKLIDAYPPLKENASKEEATRRYGDILSAAQVHLPARLLVRDLRAAGFPVVRYEIRWTPEQNRPLGYVTHGCDRVLWALREPSLQGDQRDIAIAWLNRVYEELDTARSVGSNYRRPLTSVLTLKENKTIDWAEDARWDEMMELNAAVGEFKSKL